MPASQAFWPDKHAPLQAEYKTLTGKYPNADRQIFKVLCYIQGVAGYTPAVVGESAEWTAIALLKKTELVIARRSPVRHCLVHCMGHTQRLDGRCSGSY